MDYEKIKQYRNTHNPHCQRLGIVLEDIRLGYARVTKTVTAEDANPLGLTHGGVYFSMADTVCGSAMATHGHAAVTVDANYHFFRSSKVGDVLTAEAREEKSGRTICVYRVEIRDQAGTLVGSGDFTFYQLPQEIDY
jgi:acyl-CoA thioesterase